MSVKDWSPARLLALFMLSLVGLVAVIVTTFLVTQHRDNTHFQQQQAEANRLFQARVEAAVKVELQRDLCKLITSIQPRTAAERQVQAYGARIQAGSAESARSIGCLPPPR